MIPTSFSHPAWLIALAIPALLAWWEITRQPHRLVLPFDFGSQQGGKSLGRWLRLVALLPAILLAVAIVLLAGPQRGGRPTQERLLTNIEFVVDLSGSMNSQFGQGTRFDGSLAAIQAFTTRRRGDAFGLTIFGNDVLHWTPLTKDLNAIRTATPFLHPRNMPPQFGGTEIGKAVRAALQQVRRRGTQGGILVLITDGISADLQGDAAPRIGAELAAAGVVLYAIHVGDEQSRELYELCRPNGGQVFAAENPAALDTVFSHIDRLQPVRMRPVAPRPVDAFALPALAGLALLGIYQSCAFGLRYTPW